MNTVTFQDATLIRDLLRDGSSIQLAKQKKTYQEALLKKKNSGTGVYKKKSTGGAPGNFPVNKYNYEIKMRYVSNGSDIQQFCFWGVREYNYF